MSDMLSKPKVARRAAEALGVVAKLDQMLLMLSANANPQARTGVEKLRAGLARRSDDFVEAVARVYAESYTQAELEAIVAFLESPAGRAMAAKQPSIEQRIQQVSAALLQEIERA